MDEASPRAFSLPDLLQTERGRRATALVATLAIEALLVLALLSLSESITPPEQPLLTEVDLSARDYSEPAPEQPEPEPSRADPATPQPNDAPAPVLEPVPPPAAVLPIPEAPRVPAPEQVTPPRPSTRMGAPQGPPARRSGAAGDSERVGTAPNGEPLYAARWYGEQPGQKPEVRGFFSTASPGWGLIACRTVPNFYVTDCVPLGETPGSRVSHSMLAAAGLFRVRPAQVGGRPLIGSWVRIRFDHTVQRP